LILASVYGSGVFNFFKWLHIGCAIVGFGAVVLNGVYAAQAGKRDGPGRTAVVEANHFVSTIGEYFIYAVFVLGFVLVGLSPKAGGKHLFEFSQAWVWLAILLYLVAIAIAHAVLIPTQKKMITASKAMEGGGTAEQGAEFGSLAKKAAPFGAINDVLLFVILYLMVFKPGL
jgi:uncharacterized membrane protein